MEMPETAGVLAAKKMQARLAGDTPAALEKEIRGVHDGPQPFETDGLIFVEPGHPYAQTRSYKWKGRRDTTIDCLARRAPPGACATMRPMRARAHWGTPRR